MCPKHCVRDHATGWRAISASVLALSCRAQDLHPYSGAALVYKPESLRRCFGEIDDHSFGPCLSDRSTVNDAHGYSLTVGQVRHAHLRPEGVTWMCGDQPVTVERNAACRSFPVKIRGNVRCGALIGFRHLVSACSRRGPLLGRRTRCAEQHSNHEDTRSQHTVGTINEHAAFRVPDGSALGEQKQACKACQRVAPAAATLHLMR